MCWLDVADVHTFRFVVRKMLPAFKSLAKSSNLIFWNGLSLQATGYAICDMQICHLCNSSTDDCNMLSKGMLVLKIFFVQIHPHLTGGLIGALQDF